jgi:hypothetical protein
MFFNDVIYLDDTVNPNFRKAFTGTYHTVDKWGEGDLELNLSESGILTGHFTVEEIKFELKGFISYTGLACGFLLEPTNGVPCALVRLELTREGLRLESHVPEFSELFTDNDFEKVLLHKVVEAATLEELLIGA